MRLQVRYNAHWRTWNRVLRITGDSVTEISLTHINGSWEHVLSETIRQHNRPMSNLDFERHALPLSVKYAMISVIGQDLTQRLLTHDYLAEIDHSRLPTWGIDPKGVPFSHLRRINNEQATSQNSPQSRTQA